MTGVTGRSMRTALGSSVCSAINMLPEPEQPIGPSIEDRPDAITLGFGSWFVAFQASGLPISAMRADRADNSISTSDGIRSSKRRFTSAMSE